MRLRTVSARPRTSSASRGCIGGPYTRRVPALRIRLERLGFRAAHAGLRAWWFVRRPHAHGVKCVLRAPGGDGRANVLFVRRAYGDRDEWQLPGGGIGRREEPLAAALREAHEELGVDL